MNKCSKCGESLYRLMLLALIQDAGANVYPSATKCANGGEHDLVEVESAQTQPAPQLRDPPLDRIHIFVEE